jgi:hypothetical protein
VFDSLQDDQIDKSDDEKNPIKNAKLADNLLTRFYYVNNPDNQNPSSALTSGYTTSTNDGLFPYNHDNKNGFNDLERRKKDLCNLLTKEESFIFFSIN